MLDSEESDLLLLKFAPFPDELLSSWIVRLSNAHGALLHTFCRLMWPGVSIWTRDVDTFPNDMVIERLSAKTGFTKANILTSTVSDYKGLFFDKISRGNNRWILSLGLYHRVRHRKGLQFCPTCLAEDKRSFFRKQWRLACSVLCSKHMTPLLDACSFCGTNISIHLLHWDHNGIPHCNSCNQKISNCSLPDWQVSNQLKSLHADMSSVIKNGFVTREGEDIPANDYMYGLRIFVSALTCSNYQYKLLKFGLKDSKIDSLGIESKLSKIKIFEHQNIKIRFVIMSLVAHFIHMPENQLVEKLRNNRIGGSCFFGTLYQDFPPWFMQLMDKINLNKN